MSREFAAIGYFGDKRLEKSGRLLYNRMLERGSVSLRKLAGNGGHGSKFGRFLANEKVTVNEIKEQTISRTSERVPGMYVLALQDTKK
jgi:hypothetical protein